MKKSQLPYYFYSIITPLIWSFGSVQMMGIGASPQGFLDHLIFVLVFISATCLIADLNTFAKRLIANSLLVLFISFFVLSHLFYYRFFRSWLYVDLLYHVSDLRYLGSGIREICRATDIFLFLILPFGLAVVGSLNHRPMNRRRVQISAVALLVLYAGHMKWTSPLLSLSDHNPVLYPICRFISDALDHSLHSGQLKDLNLSLKKYERLNTDLYKSTNDPDYPFEKVPVLPAQELEIEETLTSRPNVLLIVLESVRAYESGAYGAPLSYTPQFDALADRGFLVKNFYANSFQTIRGEFALLSSYYPRYRGVSYYRRIPDLPVVTMPMILRDHGYQTLWVSSFPPEKSNKVEFLKNHGFDQIYHKVPEPHTKLGWGPSDTDMFDYALTVLDKTKKPFFAEIMTLSNHYPFDADYPTTPDKPGGKRSSLYDHYTSGVFYTDHALGEFIKKAGYRTWMENTIVVVTSDHGIWVFPDEENQDMALNREKFFRLPLLFFGNPISYRGTTSVVASQIDVAPSILDLLHLYSRNSFMGTSIFQADVKDRFALMAEDHGWSLRIGNRYLYSNEQMEAFDPMEWSFTENEPKTGKIQNVGFVADEDMLRIRDRSGFAPLGMDDQAAFEIMGETLLNGANTLADLKRISRPRDINLVDQMKTARHPWTESDKFTVVAHGGGQVDQRSTPNSLEALNASYAKKFKAIELDFQFSTDGQLVALHNWDAEGPLSEDEFIQHYGSVDVTPLTLNSVLSWFKHHSDVMLVTDIKERNVEGLRQIKRKAPGLLSQIIPQVYSFEEVEAASLMGYQKIILTLYQSSYSDYEVLEFANSHRLFALTFPLDRLLNSDLSKVLRRQGHLVFTHTVNDPELFQSLIEAERIDGIYTDYLGPAATIK